MFFYILIYKIKKLVKSGFSCLKIFYYNIQGANILFSTTLSSTKITWPHKVQIGKNCIIEHNVFLKHDGPCSSGKSIIIGNNIFIGSNCEFNIRKRITVRDNTLIASGCKFIDHNHAIDKKELIMTQSGPEAEIIIEEDVWIGANVIILKGILIGKGSIIAAGAVVNRSVPEYEIWGGIPAKKIGIRE